MLNSVARSLSDSRFSRSTVRQWQAGQARGFSEILGEKPAIQRTLT